MRGPHSTNASTPDSRVGQDTTPADSHGRVEEFRAQAARPTSRSRSLKEESVPPATRDEVSAVEQPSISHAMEHTALRRSKSTEDITPYTQPRGSRSEVFQELRDTLFEDINKLHEKIKDSSSDPRTKARTDAIVAGETILTVLNKVESSSEAPIADTRQQEIHTAPARLEETGEPEPLTLVAGQRQPDRSNSVDVLPPPTSASTPSSSLNISEVTPARANEPELSDRPQAVDSSIIVHSAPKRTGAQMTRDTAIEVGMEILIHTFSYFVGSLVAEPIEKATYHDDDTRNILAHIVAVSTMAVFVISVIEDTIRSWNGKGNLNIGAALGRALVLTAPLGLYIAAISKGTLPASGVANARAVATVVANQLANRIVTVETHENPLNTDNRTGKVIDATTYGTAWMLVSAGAGFKNYVTGSSRLVATQSLEKSLLGIFNTAAAFGAAEGLGRVLPGAVRKFLRDDYGRMIPEEVVNSGVSDSEALRDATKTSVQWGKPLKPENLAVELWKGTRKGALTALFYQTVFNGLGLEGMIGASDRNPLSPGFKQAAVDGATFGAYLPIIRAAGEDLRTDNKYIPFDSDRITLEEQRSRPADEQV